MTFKNSSYFDPKTTKVVEFPFGTFYLCKNLYVAEINEGVHFDWNKAHQLADLVEEYYGKNAKIGWISNRIHSYSIDPHSWITFHENYDFLNAGAIITYNELNYMNATIEKQFSRIKIKRCHTLEQAYDWITNFKAED